MAGTAAPLGKAGYIPGIDGLRAIAVLSVVAYHLNAKLIPGGFVGVDIFFVISGFVVTQSLAGRDFPSLRSFLVFFYARRLLRIMPALIVMLLVTILATQLLVPEAWLSDTFQRVAKYAFVGGSNIALAMNDDTYFSPRSHFNPFTHTWSLGVEEQFYFVFPFIMYWHQIAGRARMSTRQVEWMLAILSLLSLVACAALSAYQHRYAFYLIPARFWELGVGMLLSLTINDWRTRIGGFSGAPLMALTGASVALLVIAFIIPETDYFPFPLALPPVLGTAGIIMLVCARPEAWISRILSSRGPVTLGLLSYSLYLWHWPVFVLFRWTVGLDSVLTACTALALVLFCSILSYALVERPVRSNARLAKMPRPVVVLGSLAVIAVSGVVGVTMFRQHDRLTWSVTRDHAIWYADQDRPLDPALTHCTLRQTIQPMGDGELRSWIPEHCSIPRPKGRLFAIGDSHNVAYSPMYRQLAAETGIEVRQYNRANCGFLKIAAPLTPESECHSFVNASFADMKANLRPEDTLFLAGLRLRRLTQEFDKLPPHQSGPDDDLKLAAGVREAQVALTSLAGTGAQIVFEAPKPVFESPPFRCADWFNHMNAICTGGFDMPRDQVDAMRAPVLKGMTEIVKGLPRMRIWDPMPILCPQTVCRAVDGHTPYFFDGDHVSGHANDLLYPSFRAMIERSTPNRPA